jgi:hypothetical protein
MTIEVARAGMARDSRLMPNALLIGAAKAGTTTLHAYLDRHPSVFCCPGKEAHFFDDDANYRRGLDAYVRDYFSGAGDCATRIDATPAYLSNAAVVAPRVAEAYRELPLPQLVCILRDPVQRAWSHYLHMRRLGKEPESFEVALDLEAERIADRGLSDWYGYFSDGQYAKHLRVWLEFFPREKIKILFTDDLRRNRAALYRELCDFLGVDFVADTDVGRKNSASVARHVWLASLVNRRYPAKTALKAILPYRVHQFMKKTVNRWNRRPMDQEAAPELDERVARELRARYEPDVADLEKLTGRSLSSWRP